MMYISDAVDGAIQLMEADSNKLKHRNAFNLTACSFSPKILAEEIKKFIPEFEISYEIEPIRQAIADSWPKSMLDYAARVEWGWNPKYDLKGMTELMVKLIKEKYGKK